LEIKGRGTPTRSLYNPIPIKTQKFDYDRCNDKKGSIFMIIILGFLHKPQGTNISKVQNGGHHTSSVDRHSLNQSVKGNLVKMQVSFIKSNKHKDITHPNHEKLPKFQNKNTKKTLISPTQIKLHKIEEIDL
jgi:hypothetical protein